MTLITAICTTEWVALAADRRITSTAPTGTTTWQADAETKVALVDGEHLMAFAGSVPTLDGIRSFEAWLNRHVHDLKNGDLLGHMETRLAVEEFFTRRRFMLVAAGFSSTSFHPNPCAELIVVSNSMNRRGDFSGTVPIHQFRTQKIARPSAGEMYILTQGEDVDIKEIDAFLAPLKSYANAPEPELTPLYEKLGHFYGEIAAQSQGRVGESALVSVLPRSSFGRLGITGRFVSLGESGASASWAFRRSDGALTDEYIPALLSSSRSARSGLSIMMSRHKADTDEEIGPRIPMIDESPGDY